MGNTPDIIITAVSENQLSAKHSEMLEEFPKEMSEQLAEALRRRRGLALKSVGGEMGGHSSECCVGVLGDTLRDRFA